MKITSEHAILKTLTYGDIFDYPLTKEELWKYLISDKPITRKAFEEEIEEPRCRGFASATGFYFKKGRGKIVTLRKKREKISERKLEIARSVCNFLKLIPTIQFIGISGGLAMSNADAKDDIDLFIIY